MERIERDAQVSSEALAIFIRAWFTSTPPVSAEDLKAARVIAA